MSKSSLRLTLDLSEDKEIRQEVWDLIKTQVISIMRDEARNLIRETIESKVSEVEESLIMELIQKKISETIGKTIRVKEGYSFHEEYELTAYARSIVETVIKERLKGIDSVIVNAFSKAIMANER